MSEKNFWVLIRTSMKNLKMYRVENRVMKGMPDVHYIRDGKSGWIELKYMSKWPKTRVATGLKLNQSLWLKEYDEHKGQCWILFRVGRDYTAEMQRKFLTDLAGLIFLKWLSIRRLVI